MSQPTVTRRIRRLEAEMAAPLLERTRPAVTPTRAGLGLLALAESVLPQWDALRAGQGPATATILQVSASTTPGEFVVPGLLRRFRRARPDVRAQLHVMNSGSVEECVRARHCDVGFLGWPPGSPRLRTIEVGQDEVVLVCPPGHRFAGRGEIDLGELAGEALVLREPGSGTRKAVEAALAARGLQLPPHRPAAEVGSGRAVLAAVAGGQGVGFVSSLVAGQAGVRIRGLPMRRSLLLVYHPQHVSPAARAFIAFVTGAPAVI